MEHTLIEKHVRPLRPIPTGTIPRGRIETHVQCVLLDVYGTVMVSAAGDIGVDGAQEDSRATEPLMRQYGIQGSPEDLAERLRAEIRREHARLREKGVDCPEVDVLSIWRTVAEIEDIQRLRAFALQYELTVNPVYPMIHFKEFLGECRRRNVKLGLISNAQFYTPLILEYFLGNSLEESGFDPCLLFYSFECGRGKPSLFMFEQAVVSLNQTGIEAKEALYVGNDMLKDMFPAASVGFKTALFAGDRRSLRLRRECLETRDLRPDLVVTDLLDIVGRVAWDKRETL